MPHAAVVEETLHLLANMLQVYQFNSVQSLEQLGRWGNMMDDSAEILFQSFLRETTVSDTGMGRGVRSLTDVVHPAFPLPINYRL